jgi:hypothetical protein
VKTLIKEESLRYASKIRMAKVRRFFDKIVKIRDFGRGFEKRADFSKDDSLPAGRQDGRWKWSYRY